MTKAIMTIVDGTTFEVSWNGTAPMIEGLEGERLEEFTKYMATICSWPVSDPIPEDCPTAKVGFTIEKRVVSTEFEMLMRCANSPSNFDWVEDMQPWPPLPE